MGGKADADAHVGEGVFEDEIPADDPGDEFAEGGVGVGVGGAGDGDHGGQLGVAEAGESADDGDEDEREGERGACSGAAGHGGVGEDVMQQRGVDDLGGGELLPGHGGADDGEDAGADDGTDAERDEGNGSEGFAEAVLGFLGLGDELIDGLSGEELGQGWTPENEAERGSLQVEAGSRQTKLRRDGKGMQSGLFLRRKRPRVEGEFWKKPEKKPDAFRAFRLILGGVLH